MSTAKMQAGVSVALPVHGGGGGPEADALLEQAVRCILRQSLQELDVMVILNGADPQLHVLIRSLAFSDSRVRLLELPEPNLPEALNLALKSARFDLVARMDADDLCHMERLEKQASFMEEHPSLAAVGCAWELIGPDGCIITVVRPPSAPQDLRWRLLLGNWLAHGSMMLRRQAVLAAGGYDTRCTRSQDYELWLRLAWGSAASGIEPGNPSGGIACLPEVLYQYRTRYPGDPGRSTPQQAAIAAPIMLRAWRQLATLADQECEALAQALTAAVSREAGPEGSIAELERLLAESPTKEALLAWLWSQWHHPPMHRRAAEICRLSRVREVGMQLRAAGNSGVYLWGAGDHTRWLLEHRESLGLPVLGIVDDHLSGEHYGFCVQKPGQLKDGMCALISSDWHEDKIWEASAAHRQRGVLVQRLYG